MSYLYQPWMCALQILMKDVRTGKKLFFVPKIGWSGGTDDVDPRFLADIIYNGGRKDISAPRLCASSTTDPISTVTLPWASQACGTTDTVASCTDAASADPCPGNNSCWRTEPGVQPGRTLAWPYFPGWRDAGSSVAGEASACGTVNYRSRTPST
jgi:hypothetical protein